MNAYKIFLASSAELTSDRREFEIFINRKNKDWVCKGIHLELVVWEDFLDCVSQTRLQDEYDKAIRECDLFVMLFCTKVGKYTAEEFQTAFDLFQKVGKPKLYTYCKEDLTKPACSSPDDQKSLQFFQEKLLALGHFQTNCKNTEDFLLKFSRQLDMLVASGFIKSEDLQGMAKVIPHALTLPPFKPEVFIGREEDLAGIKEKLFQENVQFLLISGEGGLGKTSLASEYYHANQDDYNHVAWVLSDKNIASAMLANLTLPLDVTFEQTMPLQARLDKLLLAMNSLLKPCLLVIDNANEPDDLEANYLSLLRCTNFHILLTTRISKFHNAICCPLHDLPQEKALELFRQHYPMHSSLEDSLFYQIREAIGGNTLVIEILAKNLAILNQNEDTYTLAKLIDDIQQKGLLNTSETDLLETSYHAEYKMKKVKPSEIISTMYDLANLTAEETALLSIFAVLPSEKIEFKLLVRFVNPSIKIEPILRSLTQKGWISFSQETRSYKSSPVVQEIIKKKNKRLFEDCEYLINQLVENLKYDTISYQCINVGHVEAILLVQYGISVIKTFQKASMPLVLLCDEIGVFYKTTGDIKQALVHFKECNRLLTELITIETESIDIKKQLGKSFFRLGDVTRDCGNLEQALEYYEQGNQIAKDLWEGDSSNVELKTDLADSFQRLGRIYSIKGNLTKALQYFIQYNRMEKDLYEENPLVEGYKYNLAISNGKLGDIFTSLGELGKVLEYFTEFNKLTKELCEAFPKNAGYKNGFAISCEKLGDIYTSLGYKEKADPFYTQNNQLFKELCELFPANAAYKYSLAVSYERLAGIFSSQGDIPRALESLSNQMQLFKGLYEAYPTNVSYKNNLAISYGKLGDIHTSLGDTTKSLQWFREFNQLEKELTETYPTNVGHKNFLAVSYSKLGDLYSTIGDTEKALEFLLQFHNLEKELHEAYPLDVGYKNCLAVAKYKLGVFYKGKINEKSHPIAYFEQAESIWIDLVKTVPESVEFQNSLAEVRKDKRLIG